MSTRPQTRLHVLNAADLPSTPPIMINLCCDVHLSQTAPAGISGSCPHTAARLVLEYAAAAAPEQQEKLNAEVLALFCDKVWRGTAQPVGRLQRLTDVVALPA
jgi:hypothetical protein